MHRFICVVIVTVFLFSIAGCSGGSDGSQSEQAVNAAQEVPPVGQFTDAGAALAEGSRLLDNGETEKAIEALDQAVKLDPDLADAYFKLGIAYSLLEKRDETSEVVGETPTPTPKGKKPSEQKTNSEKAFEKAVAAYKKIIAANDEDDAAHFNLGRAYNKLNEDEDAAKELKLAVKLKPDDTEYQTELGAILIKLAKYEEAIGPLKKAIELDPDNSRAQDILDDAQAGKKRVDFATKLPKDDKKNPKTDASENSNTEAAPQVSPAPASSPAPKPKPSPAKP